MIRLRLALLALATLVFTETAFAQQELPPHVFLNRITNRLIGRWPQPKENEALSKEMRSKNCASVACLDRFFRDYIEEKMEDPAFYAMAYSKVTERFGYKSPPSPLLSLIIEAGREMTNTGEGRDFMLVYRTFKENKSIDELFTSQRITDPIYPGLSVSGGNADFFSIDSSPVGMGAESPTSYSLILEDGRGVAASEYTLRGHPNIAGMFSSQRFLTRYWNSPLNANRKRAAAYFRVMLCDAMSPALERETQKEKELRIALGISDEKLTEEELKKIHLNRHGNQKDCAVCHNRLDPIGRSMRGMENGISGVPFKANLRYLDPNGKLTDIPVDNFSKLITKTTEQSKYLDCQVNWMIETYLGKDLGLQPQRFAEIVAIVEKKKRRVKDIVTELMMLPEFRGLNQKIVEPAALVSAKAALSNCTECHRSFFSLRPEQLKARMSRIAVCLDLPGEGQERAMPPSDHWWHPSQGEVLAVRDWIRQGAPISHDTKLFDNTEVDRLLSKGNGAKKCRE